MRRVRWSAILVFLLNIAGGFPIHAQPEEAAPYRLDDALQVLADDVESPAYRQLVDRMLVTDLEAEWQRVETADNADSFLARHGGKEKVLADPDLKRAYERRLEIRDKFLDIMRAGYARHKRVPPFDQGATALKEGTVRGSFKKSEENLSVVLPSPEAERHWPRFRGPSGQGETDQTPLPVEWSAERNVLWRTGIPGSGNSSPVIWGDRIFLTSAGDEGAERTLHCLARNDGKLLWSRTIPEHEVEPKVRDKNGFASATPVTDGERVISFFGNGGLVCHDFEGKLLWHYPLPGFDTTWGTAASPLLYDESVILIHDQNKADSLFVALDKRTGKRLYQGAPRARSMGWSTPVVVRVGGRDELIYAGGMTVKGYAPRTGSELWSLDGPTREVVPTVVVGPNLVYTASGRQGPTIGFRPGGSGNVTSTHQAWLAVRGGPHVPSPIYVGGRLYTINDTGIATCLDGQTGKQIWQARLRDLFSASPIAAGDLMYFCAESGVTYVVRAGDKLNLVAKNDLASPILASPAALQGKLYVRTAESLFCIGQTAAH
jgi:outer membrane protein assembly factor BamB